MSPREALWTVHPTIISVGQARPLDWKSFSKRAEAEASAKELALVGETYTVEELDGNCPRCRDMTKSKSAFRT